MSISCGFVGRGLSPVRLPLDEQSADARAPHPGNGPLVGHLLGSGLATNSIFFCFIKKSLICMEGKSLTASQGKYFSLLFLPATPLSASRSPDSPHVWLLELQRNKKTSGAKVSGHRQTQLTQALIVRLLKTHFYINP